MSLRIPPAVVPNAFAKKQRWRGVAVEIIAEDTAGLSVDDIKKL